MEIYYEEMDMEVLGKQETPDIETLANALLAWEGGGVYRARLASGDVLRSFLQGSESLWGMVDWEAGNCDYEEMYLPPVHRKSFDRWLEWEIRQGSEVRFENGHTVHPVYYGENTFGRKEGSI